MIIYLTIVGMLLGSFYNVVGLRVPKNKSIIGPRSFCPTCHHTLTAIELIPLISYLLQKGKCRKCKKKISPLYPLVELMTAFLFMISPLLVGFSLELIIALTLISLFMIIFVSDVTYMLIPDRILFFFLILVVVERVIYPLTPYYDSLVGGVVAFSLLFFIAYISKGGMGGGDIKLFAVLGVALGLKIVLLAFFLSTLFGVLDGVCRLIFLKHKKREPIPFVPSIMIGTLIAYFFGNEMIDWYFELIGLSISS